MTLTTFKVSTAALRLLAIACILLVVVQVTEAARELDDGVGGVLVMNREQVASVHTKAELIAFAELTAFQAAVCELLHLPCAVQSSNAVTACGSAGAYCFFPQDCCSRTCNYNGMLPPTCG
jgi:hypothetical protein